MNSEHCAFWNRPWSSAFLSGSWSHSMPGVKGTSSGKLASIPHLESQVLLPLGSLGDACVCPMLVLSV